MLNLISAFVHHPRHARQDWITNGFPCKLIFNQGHGQIHKRGYSSRFSSSNIHGIPLHWSGSLCKYLGHGFTEYNFRKSPCPHHFRHETYCIRRNRVPKEIKGDMNGQGLNVGIVVARFNEIITRKLLDSAVETLIRYGVRDEDISVSWVQGSFELPVVAKSFGENRPLPCRDLSGCGYPGRDFALRYGCWSSCGWHQLRGIGHRSANYIRRTDHREHGTSVKPCRWKIWEHGCQYGRCCHRDCQADRGR